MRTIKNISHPRTCKILLNRSRSQLFSPVQQRVLSILPKKLPIFQTQILELSFCNGAKDAKETVETLCSSDEEPNQCETGRLECSSGQEMDDYGISCGSNNQTRGRTDDSRTVLSSCRLDARVTALNPHVKLKKLEKLMNAEKRKAETSMRKMIRKQFELQQTRTKNETEMELLQGIRKNLEQQVALSIKPSSSPNLSLNSRVKKSKCTQPEPSCCF